VSGRRKATSTSAFGVGRRENHDASGFYARFTPPVLTDDDHVSTSPIEGKIIEGDARRMGEVEDASVALVVTSPPYFAGKEYEEALGEGHVPASYLDYLAMLTDVFAECVRTLEPGGRIAVNVANLGRKPYRSLSADVIGILQDDLGLLLRGEVIWRKARGASASCAWGSFRSPANPVLRDVTERVVIASKGRFDRAVPRRARATLGLPSEISVTKDEFIEATTDVWEIPSERANRVGHPAPFPVELPLRLVELYTYRGDLVLDPFIGSGTTAVAALRGGRRYVGYDTETEYVRIAEQRADEERDRLLRDELKREEARLASPPSPTRRARSGAGGDVVPDVSRRDGATAREWAGELLARCGFSDISSHVRIDSGVEVDYRAVDGSGHPWLFDVWGSFTTVPSGLRRTDTLWRALGKAAVVRMARPEVPLVLLTTSVPRPGSAEDRAWRALGQSSPGGAMIDVVSIDSTEDIARLCGYAAGRRRRGSR
jgi:site-specific DNA-methyltransferase (adenine-specific)